MGGAAALTLSQLLQVCGHPCDCCIGSKRPPDFPMRIVRRAILARRDQASIQKPQRFFRKTGRYCDRAARCSSGKVRDFVEECGGKPATVSRMAHSSRAKKNALGCGLFLPLERRPSTIESSHVVRRL